MYFAYENIIEACTLAADSFSSVYSVENIQDWKLTKIWKGTETDGDQRIVIDAGADITPDLIAILGHNFTDETITIQANDSDAWGAPAYSYEFTSIEAMMVHAYEDDPYRYWSILIEGCNVPETPPEVGLVYIGAMEEFTNPDTITPSGIDDSSVFEKSKGFELYGTKGELTKQSFKLDFSILAESEYEVLKGIFQEVGKAIPFIIIWSLTASYAAVPNIYCNFMSGISIDSMTGFQIASLSFLVEECK